jgi:DNA-binding transcriptional LysR family regulator
VREVQELSTIIGLVDAGVGIAIVPADTRSIHLQGVAYVPLRDKDAFSTLFLAFRERDRSGHLRGLLSKLRERSQMQSKARKRRT